MAQAPAQHQAYDWEPLQHGAMYQFPAAVAHLAGGFRKVLRERTPLETELGTWVQDDGTLAPPVKTRLMSLHSKESCFIKFTNKSTKSVQAIWLDFKGNEVGYSHIEPNTSKKYRTYVTHPWIIKDTESGERMMLGKSQVVYGTSKAQEVTITQPPTLPWNAKTHTHFPESYKQAARSLLLCHNHLAKHGAPATGALWNELQSQSKWSKHVSSHTRHQPYVLFAFSRLANWCHRTQAVSPEPYFQMDEDMKPAFKPQHAVVSVSVAVSCGPNTTTATATRQPHDQRHLGDLPFDVVIDIVKHLAPEIRQCITMTPNGHPDIHPALLPGNPAAVEKSADPEVIDMEL